MKCTLEATTGSSQFLIMLQIPGGEKGISIFEGKEGKHLGFWVGA